ncbi:MAG: serine O-acetyltransferase EpsC [Capnocytophaga sp.]|nr:serine O-acetyltransferase EpsC [Capnocytophaga sp.]
MSTLLIDTLYAESKKITHHAGKQRIENFADGIFNLLFLVEENDCRSRNCIENRYQELKTEFETIVSDFCSGTPQTPCPNDFFENKLPEIHRKLTKDALYFAANDPAATSVREVQLTYPGFFAIAVYRFAHELWLQQTPLLPRMLTEYAHSRTGIDIHPGAEIGENFMIDHGTGTVIGETSIIGNNVKIYQGVTLGALSVSIDKANTKRHPTIEDDVVIYAGATILGGETVIGHDCIIGGNVWLTQSIEPYTKVFHKSQIIVKGIEIIEEPINYVI